MPNTIPISSCISAALCPVALNSSWFCPQCKEGCKCFHSASLFLESSCSKVSLNWTQSQSDACYRASMKKNGNLLDKGDWPKMIFSSFPGAATKEESTWSSRSLPLKRIFPLPSLASLASPTDVRWRVLPGSSKVKHIEQLTQADRTNMNVTVTRSQSVLCPTPAILEVHRLRVTRTIVKTSLFNRYWDSTTYHNDLHLFLCHRWAR